MSTLFVRRCLSFGLCIAAVTCSQAAAQYGFGGSCGFGGFPGGYGNNGPAAYALGNIPAPPYFALHPPVYYSHSVARPYGRSPFACGCNCEHGQQHSASRKLANAFMPRMESLPPASNQPTKSDSTEKMVKVAEVPKRITNPFYKSTDAADLASGKR